MDLLNYRIVDLSHEVVPNADEDRPFRITPGRLSDDALRYDVQTHTHVEFSRLSPSRRSSCRTSRPRASRSRSAS